MKIMIMTDLEGVAGVLDFENWCRNDSRYKDKGKRLLSLEVNAAIEAFLQAGFDQIEVADGHGSGAIDPELLHPLARLRRGGFRPTYPMGLDRGVDAYAVVGQHAKSRTPYSHLTHTQSCATLYCSVNGYEIGEFGEGAFCAAELGIPTIFASGEKALCLEAEELAPGIVCAAVKEGILPDDYDHYDRKSYAAAKLSAIHLSPSAARELIGQKAAEAAKKFFSSPESFSYRKLSAPYEIIRSFRASEGQPPRTLISRHPSSFIAAMNAERIEQ